MEPDFTNREIEEMFKDVQNSLARIETQTTKHNGRMTKLERWQAYITGAFSVIIILMLPLLGWALYKLVNIDSSIQDSVDRALSAYEITNTTNENN